MSYLSDRVAKAISENRRDRWVAEDGPTREAAALVVSVLLKADSYDGDGFGEEICGPGTSLAMVARWLRHNDFVVSEHETGPEGGPYIHVSVPKPEGEK